MCKDGTTTSWSSYIERFPMSLLPRWCRYISVSVHINATRECADWAVWLHESEPTTPGCASSEMCPQVPESLQLDVWKGIFIKSALYQHLNTIVWGTSVATLLMIQHGFWAMQLATRWGTLWWSPTGSFWWTFHIFVTAKPLHSHMSWLSSFSSITAILGLELQVCIWVHSICDNTMGWKHIIPTTRSWRMFALSGRWKEVVPRYDRREDGKGQKIKLVHCKYFCATGCYTCVCVGSVG